MEKDNNAMFFELPTWKKSMAVVELEDQMDCAGAEEKNKTVCFKACLEEWTEKTRRTVALVYSYNTHSPVAAFF